MTLAGPVGVGAGDSTGASAWIFFLAGLSSPDRVRVHSSAVGATLSSAQLSR
jgi:hypothetical protein